MPQTLEGSKGGPAFTNLRSLGENVKPTQHNEVDEEDELTLAATVAPSSELTPLLFILQVVAQTRFRRGMNAKGDLHT